MKTVWLLFAGFLVILFCGFVSAYPTAYSGVQYTISEFVFTDDYAPINADSCNVSIWYPNNTALILNQSMGRTGNWNYYNVTLTSPLGLYHALIRCSFGGDYGALEKSFYLNSSTPITLFQNFINAHGTHEYGFYPGGYSVWANVTGNASSGNGSLALSVVNPNPGNGTFLTNFLQARSSGLTTAVDISGNTNFTELTESNLGTGNIKENYSSYDSDEYITVYNPPIGHHYSGQSFTESQSFTANSTYVLNKIKLYLYKDAGATGTVNITLHKFLGTVTDVKFGDTLSEGYIDVGTIGLVYGYHNISMSPVLIIQGEKYCFRFKNIGGDDGTPLFVWFALDSSGSFTDGGYVEYLPMFPSGVYIETTKDIKFYIYGWSLGGNITWDHVLNQTWSSNSSGSWVPYASTIAVSNGTQSVLNTNFTSNDTIYYYRVVTSNSSGVEVGNMTVTFTTAQRKQIIPFGGTSNHLSMGVAVGLMFGGLGGVVLMGSRRRRRSDASYGGRV